MKETKVERQAWSPKIQEVYVDRAIARACPENQPTLRAFADWLRSQGLSPETITLRLASACCFVDTVTACGETSCDPRFQSLTPEGVEDFFVRYGQDHGMAARRSMRSAMRSLLKFAASRGWVGRELAEAVPKLRGYRLSGLPRGINEEELEILLGSPWEGGSCCRRDRAVVYLLATYGVRRQQVSALQLTDIDWVERTIVFAAHKGGKAIDHALTEAVGGSLADYIRNERPQ